PRFDLVRPDGSHITPETVGEDVLFAQNAETRESFYVVTNPAAGDWTYEAENPAQGPFEFVAWGPNAEPVLAGVQATPAGSDVQITYNAADPDSDAKVSLYYDTKPSGTGGTLIVGDLPESAAGSYTWKAGDGSVPAGEYYVYALVE